MAEDGFSFDSWHSQRWKWVKVYKYFGILEIEYQEWPFKNRKKHFARSWIMIYEMGGYAICVNTFDWKIDGKIAKVRLSICHYILCLSFNKRKLYIQT